ncbi:3-oxoacyl-ACP synthase [Roseivirga echinicomitans]
MHLATMLEIKIQLFNHWTALVNERISNIEEAMRNAQASANEETKSSAGDKYETGRAMMHLEKEKLATQLSEVSKMKMGLDQINPEKNQLLAELGSVVITSNAKYFLSVSLGQIKVEDEVYFAISPASPIGRAMFGKKKGDSFDFGGKQINLLDVF